MSTPQVMPPPPPSQATLKLDPAVSPQSHNGPGTADLNSLTHAQSMDSLNGGGQVDDEVISH